MIAMADEASQILKKRKLENGNLKLETGNGSTPYEKSAGR